MMMKERWVAAAFTSDALVAELLLRLKQSASPESSPLPTTSTTATATTALNPVGWGDRKSRSKPSTAVSFTVSNGIGKVQPQRSPTTPLSWSGGGAPSTSDGCDESSRRSDLDLSSGDRYVKVEGSTTYIDDISRKRKIDLHQEMEIRKRQFVLPDLNEIPVYE